VDSNKACTATFMLNTYTLTPTAGAGGNITPNTPQAVNYGDSVTFTIAPDVGYHIADVGVDGISQGPLTAYAFTNITAHHTLSAAFAINTYVITPTAGANGSITPATPQTLNHGDSVTFTIAPDSGFAIADVLVDGASVGVVSSYTFNTITAPHTISASFVANLVTLTVTLSGTQSGSVTSAPSGISCGVTCAASFTIGTAVTLTATPHVGSAFTGWSGAGCGGTGGCVITLNTAESVSAAFEYRRYLPFMWK
jgi:hypothetical protein